MMTKLLGALGALILVFSLACGNRCPPSGPIDAPVPTQGAVSARWTIMLRSQLVACALVGAASVELTLHPHTGDSDVTLTRTCSSSTATLPIAAGTYDVTPSLLSSDGQTIVNATPQADVVITTGQTIELAPITFAPTTRTGELALRVAAVGQGTNCQTATGQFIQANTLTLRTIDGRCADVSITRSRGGVVVGKYLVNCDQPALTTCIEQDETLSVDGGITAGQYAIAVSGETDPSVCFLGQEALIVGPGVTNHATIQLNPLRSTGC